MVFMASEEKSRYCGEVRATPGVVWMGCQQGEMTQCGLRFPSSPRSKNPDCGMLTARIWQFFSKRDLGVSGEIKPRFVIAMRKDRSWGKSCLHFSVEPRALCPLKPGD